MTCCNRFAMAAGFVRETEEDCVGKGDDNRGGLIIACRLTTDFHFGQASDGDLVFVSFEADDALICTI